MLPLKEHAKQQSTPKAVVDSAGVAHLITSGAEDVALGSFVGPVHDLGPCVWD